MSDFAVIPARGLPAAPLDAARAFADSLVALVRAERLDVVVLFDHADHTHGSWRKAAIEELAREAAPRRVNALAGPDGQGAADAMAYLARAPGVTGQVLALAPANG